MCSPVDMNDEISSQGLTQVNCGYIFKSDMVCCMGIVNQIIMFDGSVR